MLAIVGRHSYVLGSTYPIAFPTYTTSLFVLMERCPTQQTYVVPQGSVLGPLQF